MSRTILKVNIKPQPKKIKTTNLSYALGYTNQK